MIADVPANGHVIESEDVAEAPANTQDEVKIPKLGLFMDKVFETNHHLNGSDHKLNNKSGEENLPTESNEEADSAVNNNEEAITKTEQESNDNAENENLKNK